MKSQTFVLFQCTCVFADFFTLRKQEVSKWMVLGRPFLNNSQIILMSSFINITYVHTHMNVQVTVCKNSIRESTKSIHGWTEFVTLSFNSIRASCLLIATYLMHMPAAVFLSVSFMSHGIYHPFSFLAAFASDFKNRSARRGKSAYACKDTSRRERDTKVKFFTR